jgi:hypothetical protein
MTVERSGDCGGDLGGDLATPSPAREGSSDWLGGSRFWVLQASDDEDEDGGVEPSSPRRTNVISAEDKPIAYLCRTPSPVDGIVMADESQDLARRAIKRLRKRDAQRMATKTTMMFASLEGMSLSSPVPLGTAKFKSSTRPVMEPSVFMDDGDGGWTVVHRRHRPAVITGKIQISNNAHNSKSRICLVWA